MEFVSLKLFYINPILVQLLQVYLLVDENLPSEFCFCKLALHFRTPLQYSLCQYTVRRKSKYLENNVLDKVVYKHLSVM